MSFELDSADATAIVWTDNVGVGISGTGYVMSLVQDQQDEILRVGLASAPAGHWFAGVRVRSDGSVDRKTLEMMAGREELITAAVGASLRAASPELLQRAVVALQNRIHTLNEQIAGGRDDEGRDVHKLQIARHQLSLQVDKISAWSVASEHVAQPRM